MKKKNNLTKTVIIMLIITMLALIALSGTYAKYTTQVTGSGTAIIGNWTINITKDSGQLENEFEIDLADTITSGDTGNNFIQPGSSGSFTIKVENAGDVPAIIKAELDSESSSSIFNQGQFTIEAAGNITGETGYEVADSSTEDVTITWSWDYENEDGNKIATVDADDTSIGATATDSKQTICSIKLTATQKNPNGQ